MHSSVYHLIFKEAFSNAPQVLGISITSIAVRHAFAHRVSDQLLFNYYGQIPKIISLFPELNHFISN